MVSLSAIALMTDDDALTEAVMAEAEELDEGSLVLKDPRNLLRRFRALWKLYQVCLFFFDWAMTNLIDARGTGRCDNGGACAVKVGTLSSVIFVRSCFTGRADGVLRPNGRRARYISYQYH